MYVACVQGSAVGVDGMDATELRLVASCLLTLPNDGFVL